MTEREQRAFDEWVLQAYRQHASVQRISDAAAKAYPAHSSRRHVQAALDRARRHESAASMPLPASASGEGRAPSPQNVLLRA